MSSFPIHRFVSWCRSASRVLLLGMQGFRMRSASCSSATRQIVELEYQRRRAAHRNAEPPTTVNRVPEGCREAKQQEEERQRQQAERKEKEAHAAVEERQ